MHRKTRIYAWRITLECPKTDESITIPVRAHTRQAALGLIANWLRRGWFLKRCIRSPNTVEPAEYEPQELAMRDPEQQRRMLESILRKAKVTTTTGTEWKAMSLPEDTSESDGLKTFFRQFWSGRWDHGRSVIKTIRSQLRWAIQELRALKRKQK